MQFRTIAELNKCIVRNLTALPRDIDLIVGIPRSGLLPATILALHLNLPLTDVDGLLNGRVFECGLHRSPARAQEGSDSPRRVLVIDDSIVTGRQMEETRRRIEATGIAGEIMYAAVYSTARVKDKVDIYFEICPVPRVFEWNLFHHSYILGNACVDIDGVLCRDPSPEENDDGHQYRRFLEDAHPLILPSVPVGFVVTCRLEKYRSLTEAWLRRHGIRYGRLIMMDYPNQAARQAAGNHAAFKAACYRSTNAGLFIESSRVQAIEIAQRSGRPVICVETPEIIYPPPLASAKDFVRRSPRALARRCKAVVARIIRRAGKHVRGCCRGG